MQHDTHLKSAIDNISATLNDTTCIEAINCLQDAMIEISVAKAVMNKCEQCNFFVTCKERDKEINDGKK